VLCDAHERVITAAVKFMQMALKVQPASSEEVVNA